MKNKIVMMGMFCLLLAVGAAFAQEKKTDFAGDWTLDINKSTLGERSRIESMTMKVTQTVRDLAIETKAKIAERTDGEGRGGGFGRGRGMLSGDGNQSSTYTLDGKETTIQSAGPFGGETKFKAEAMKDGKMKLVQTRNIETPRGAMTTKTIETWELQDGGKTLKIVREMETPRGNRTSEMIFTKK